MRTTKLVGTAVVAITIGLAGCGGGSHLATGPGGLSTSSWPAHLDNTKIAAVYNTANDSPTIVDCAAPAATAALSLPERHVNGIGGTTGGPKESELVGCAYVGQKGSIGITLGPVGASTWTDPANVDPARLHEATVIPGAGALALPYTEPTGWRWQISYGYGGSYTQADALTLAHAVAANLAAH